MKLFHLPYPESSSKKEILISSLYAAIAVFIFLVIFQPFGTYNFSHRFKYLLLAPYSLITFLIFALANFLLRGKADHWNVQKEALKIFSILSICSVFNYLYNSRFINHTAFNINHLMYMFLYTLAVGIPISMIYILGRYIYLKNISSSINYPGEKPSLPVSENKTLTIQAEAGNESLKLVENHFLFATSDGNYCTVFYSDNTVLRKRLLRLSLKSLEEQVNGGAIIRCHRSFIINTNKIVTIKGNAQGYKLSLKNTETTIPVSRKYIEILRAHINPN